MCSLKAGNGTRTRVGSLEGYCTSSVLCPRYMVGREGFEPSKRKRNRFTVCPLWPLGYLPKTFQSRREELNPQPSVYKTLALPLSYVGINYTSLLPRESYLLYPRQSYLSAFSLLLLNLRLSRGDKPHILLP